MAIYRKKKFTSPKQMGGPEIGVAHKSQKVSCLGWRCELALTQPLTTISAYRHTQPVCIESRTSALNITLPAVGAQALQLSTDICCPRPGCGKLQMLIDGTDGRTDGRTPVRFLNHELHSVQAASTMLVL